MPRTMSGRRKVLKKYLLNESINQSINQSKISEKNTLSFLSYHFSINYYVLHKHIPEMLTYLFQLLAAIISWKHVSTPPQNVWKLWKQVDIDNTFSCFMMIWFSVQMMWLIMPKQFLKPAFSLICILSFKQGLGMHSKTDWHTYTTLYIQIFTLWLYLLILGFLNRKYALL